MILGPAECQLSHAIFMWSAACRAISGTTANIEAHPYPFIWAFIIIANKFIAN